MTRPVFAIASNIVSSLGNDVQSHWQAIQNGITGIKQYDDTSYSLELFYGSMIEEEAWGDIKESLEPGNDFTRFEQLCYYSVKSALQQVEGNALNDDTVLILSTTKGNIELLEEAEDDTTLLHASADNICKALGLSKKPVIVSHACVSGAVALLHGLRLIQNDRYKNAIVVGCDRFTPFVLNGFQSFQAVADGPCKPFDKNRTGINLGEAAATIILSAEHTDSALAKLVSGSTSNDANHISGPSRTGEELYYAIDRAMQEANVSADDIQMISTHGTATMYNDEMEAKAINLAKLSDVPLHSIKGYTGHTLGAAGVLESAMLIEAINKQQTIPSLGYDTHGVSVPLKVSTEAESCEINNVLKTASGFGGCNAALIWSKA